jgi:putative FmdB family regulatory protein
MPIYEFRCDSCGEVSEVLVFSNSAEVTCPACGSNDLTKLMSQTSSLTGSSHSLFPGPKDTGCCGSRPGDAPSCAGPGSCCGKT